MNEFIDRIGRLLFAPFSGMLDAIKVELNRPLPREDEMPKERLPYTLKTEWHRPSFGKKQLHTERPKSVL